MEYEGVEEEARYKQACENVKKIANAIKTLKLKYYPNFGKISEEDKIVYNQLQQRMDEISENHDLNYLKIELMEEISAKYDKDAKSMQGETTDSRLLACYGAIDAEQKALSQGKIKQALRCQELLKQFLNEIDEKNYIELITNYKREKLGELIRTKEIVQEQNENWDNMLKEFCKPETAQDRKSIIEMIECLQEQPIKNL